MSHRAAVAGYLVAIVLANLTVVWFGPAWSVVNAFLFIGLDLTLRDRLHDAWRGRHLAWRMGGLIAAGSAIAWAFNADAGRIGLASFLAFGLAMTADAVVYHVTGSRRWSNVTGAVVDSFVFPGVAFGAFLPAIVAGQIIAKIAGAEVWLRALARIEERTTPATTD